MNWRPNNWEEIKCKCSFQSEDGGMVPHLPSMEVGADAMLDALKKLGFKIKNSDNIRLFKNGKGFLLGHDEKVKCGWIIIIPELKEEQDASQGR
jgi:hypothetical protein